MRARLRWTAASRASRSSPPKKGQLTCPEHSEECGFVYVPAVLRFSERKAPDQKVSEAAELWFQQSKWVLAKPFSR